MVLIRKTMKVRRARALLQGLIKKYRLPFTPQNIHSLEIINKWQLRISLAYSYEGVYLLFGRVVGKNYYFYIICKNIEDGKCHINDVLGVFPTTIEGAAEAVLTTLLSSIQEPSLAYFVSPFGLRLISDSKTIKALLKDNDGYKDITIFQDGKFVRPLAFHESHDKIKFASFWNNVSH